MNSETSKCIQLHPGEAGLLTVWIDSPERSVNVFDADMLAALEAAIAHIEDHPYRVVVFRSRKSSGFFAGADVKAIARLETSDAARAIIVRGQQLMQRIADLRPLTVAVIEGVCMGGGLEFALACSHRVASDSSRTKMGLPEIRLGLIPAWGGTQRLPKLVGLRQALKMILKGSSLDAVQARRWGLVDQIVAHHDLDTELERFTDALPDGPISVRSRSRSYSRSWLAWLLDSTLLGRAMVLRAARKQVASQEMHYPALPRAIKAISLSNLGGSAGYRYECEAFSELLFTSTAQNLLGLFSQRDLAKKTSTWTDESKREGPSDDPSACRRLAVIGAGAMGAGIGVLAAEKGLEVVFKEVNAEAAQAGVERIEQLLARHRPKRDGAALQPVPARERIAVTTQWADLSECDLAIEAVLEIDAVKRDVFRQLDSVLPTGATLASNTSSLSVTKMATATQRKQRVAGLHFFNPVDRMELVEVVRTEMTDDATVSQLLELVRRLGKTPIVTSDKPGFLVNRVLFPYLGEAVRMVAEGVSVARIDGEMKRFGMPMGPLELMDHVGVDIASHVASTLREIQSDAELPAAYLADMAARQWLGKKVGLGFYRWGKTKQANSQLVHECVPPDIVCGLETDSMTSIQRRLVYPILNEAVHCLDELVVTEPWMVDLGMVLGTGFAPMHGGPLRLIDTLGGTIVLHNMRMLEESFGKRFAPADGLGLRAARHESFYANGRVSNSLTWESNHESQYTNES